MKSRSLEKKSESGFQESPVVERALRPPDLITSVTAQLLCEGRSVRFKARGRSMYPTIRDSEIITVNPVNPSSLRTGEIILYRLGGNLIAHRIARIDRIDESKMHFILRSDTSGEYDEPVEPHQVLGKVVCVRRQGRNIALYTLRVKLRLVAHSIASRLKRMIRS